MTHQPFVYQWTHLPTLRWYVGSRTRKKCHLNDGYICSSKQVKQLILDNPSDWTRTILATGTAEEMVCLETEILQTTNAKHDPRSYNQHNNDRAPVRTGIPHSEKSKQKMRGPRNPIGPQTDDHIEKRISKKRGIPSPSTTLMNQQRVGEKHWCYNKKQKFEHVEARISRIRGKAQDTLLCPHCNKEGGKSIMQRWHFANCKLLKEK